MSKSNTHENSYLLLLFNATTFNGLAENDSTSPNTQLFLALHTADPGEAGGQTTSECAYGAYARVAVDRDNTGFTVSGNSVVLAADATFPEATSGTETVTHFSVGLVASGASTILYSGTVTPNISVVTGTIPILTTGTTITED
jgi:hypothetical protein